MVDLFAQEGLTPNPPQQKRKPVDLFAQEGINPPSITERNQAALKSTIDLSSDDQDIQPIKEEALSHAQQMERLAQARFSPEKIEEMKSRPINAGEAMDWLEVADVVPFGGLKQGADALGIKNIADKLQEGNAITPAEQQKMDEYIDKTVEMNIRGMTFGGKVVYYGSSMPAFIAEFAATGGVGKIAASAATKAITKGVQVGAVRAATAKVASVTANVAARSAVMPSMYVEKYGERRLNDFMSITDKGQLILKDSKESPASSALKAFAYTNAEVASELSGATIGKYLVNPVTKVLKTPLTQGINKLPTALKTSLFNAYKKIQPNARVSKIFTAGGWNGMINELGEERVADILRESLAINLEEGYTFDQVLDGITPSKEQLLLEAGLISIMGGAKTSADITMNILKSKGATQEQAVEAVNNLTVAEQEALIHEEFKINPKSTTLDIVATSDIASQKPVIKAVEDPIIKSQRKVATEGDPPAIDNSESNFNKFYRDWVDTLAPIEAAEKLAVKRGADIAVGESPNLLARTYSGVIGMARQNLQNETYTIKADGNVEVTGKGLRPILEDFDNSIILTEPKREAREKDLREYMIARRTLQDLAGREDVSVSEKTLAEQSSIMSGLAQKYGEDFQWFDIHAKEIYDYQARILKNLVDSGSMSKKQYDEILTNNPNYIPFQRILEDDGFKDAITSKGIFTGANANKVIKRIKGSDKEIKDPINSIIANTVKILDISYRNRVAQSVVKLADFMPEYIQKVKTPMQKITVGDVVTFRPSGIEPKGSITVFEKGKKKYYQVSKPILEAMQQLQPTQLTFLQKLFSVPAAVLRTGATLVPEFWVRNVLRDQTSAFIQSKVRPTPIDMVQGLTSLMGRGDIYNEWMKSGGSFNSYMELSDKGLENAYTELFKPSGKINRYLRNPLNLPADISGALEQGTRIGVFSKAKKKGLSDLEAALEARQATLDFARGGARAKVVNRIIPFFNAGVQGSDKLVRTLKENPSATMMWGAATITFPSVLLTGYYLYGAPEEERKEYLEIPQWQRDMFWVFKEGDVWVRYPKPFSLGYLFGSVPERFMTWMYKGEKPEGEAMWRDLTLGVAGAFSPVYDASALLPPLVKVAVETATNYNFFTGRNIYPTFMEDLEPEQRKNKYTSETAVAVGEAVGVSPALIDNALRGTLAGSAQYVTGAGDTILNQVKKWNGEEISEKPSSLSDTPLIRAFVVRDPTGAAAQSTANFYETADMTSQVSATFNKLEGEEKQAYLEKNEILIQAAEGMETYSKQISSLNKQRNLIYQDAGISGDDKADMLKELDDQILIIAREGNQFFKEAVLDGE